MRRRRRRAAPATASDGNSSRSTTTAVAITNSAGSSRRARRTQNPGRSMPPVRPSSSSSSEVIRNPLSTKNTSTPMNPPGHRGCRRGRRAPARPPTRECRPAPGCQLPRRGRGDALGAPRSTTRSGGATHRWPLTAEILPARADAKVPDTPSAGELLRLFALTWSARCTSSRGTPRCPRLPPSRPKPDSLTPPNGAAGSEITPRLTPTMPDSIALGDPQRAVEVAGVDVGGQAVLGVVGGGHALLLGVEAGDRGDRAEHLLLEDAGVGGHVGEHRRRIEVARAARSDAADGDRCAAATPRRTPGLQRWPPAWR